MANDEPNHKSVKIGVKAGAGLPPGYQWTVEILDCAFDEGTKFLIADQYQHLAQQVRELARQDDPTHSQTIDIRPVEKFYELRDKGGILGRLNVRVFYLVHKDPHLIVIPGVIKKENNGPTPSVDKIRMRRRRRHYLDSLPSRSPTDS